MPLKLNMCLAAVLFSWLLPLQLSADIEFLQKDLSEVRQMAAQEGKLYFAHFSAEWCMICDWMEENTFKDPLLEPIVAENYLPVRVDYDDEQNQRYNEQYRIKALPTILIFNSQGVLIEKIQYSIEAEEFLKILQKHNLARNRLSPEIETPGMVLNSPKRNKVLFRPALRPDAYEYSHIASENNSSSYPSFEDNGFGKPVQPKPVSSTPNTPPKIKTMPTETEISTAYTNSTPQYQYSINMPPSNPPSGYDNIPSTEFMAPRSSRKYYIQLGVHSDYKKAVQQKIVLEKQLGQKIHLKSSLERNQNLYKVITYEFPDFSSAQHHYKALKEKSVFGLIQLVE